MISARTSDRRSLKVPPRHPHRQRHKPSQPSSQRRAPTPKSSPKRSLRGLREDLPQARETTVPPTPERQSSSRPNRAANCADATTRSWDRDAPAVRFSADRRTNVAAVRTNTTCRWPCAARRSLRRRITSDGRPKPRRGVGLPIADCDGSHPPGRPFPRIDLGTSSEWWTWPLSSSMSRM
jgi:hypothetical protein